MICICEVISLDLGIESTSPAMNRSKSVDHMRTVRSGTRIPSSGSNRRCSRASRLQSGSRIQRCCSRDSLLRIAQVSSQHDQSDALRHLVSLGRPLGHILWSSREMVRFVMFINAAAERWRQRCVNA